ncbi:uncharacterized protein LOC134692593 [Mytilus trossulus]|uniref:uncharacterized protein LOC134692593 n=1 Tax=Mytilus trossulus TaxID=6551 RepID=UPI003006EA95
MKVQFLIVFFLAAVRCQATESVLDLFPEFKQAIGGLQTRIDGLVRENKVLKAEVDRLGKAGSGNTYTRWGKTSCPSTAALVYEGYAAGNAKNEKGGGANFLCLPKDPSGVGIRIVKQLGSTKKSASVKTVHKRMKVQFLIVFFLNAVRCQATESVLDLFPEFKREIGRIDGLQTRIDGLERENKALKARDLSRQVAFTAYISSSINGNNFGKGRTMIYDKIVTNKGDVYNKNTGKFTANSDGTYAFTWTINAGWSPSHGEVTIELMKNTAQQGVQNVDTERDYDNASSTAFTVITLSAGDVVFTRSSPYEAPEGNLRSDKFGRWTFSGWKLF